MVWCETCHAYFSLDVQPISSRTRSRTETGNLSSGAIFPPTVDPPTTPTAGRSTNPVGEPLSSPLNEMMDADNPGDSEYSDSASDTSSTDSAGYEDEPIPSAEVERLSLPLCTWERIDLEDHIPLHIVRTLFPETRSLRHLSFTLKCVNCEEAVHHDDFFSLSSPDFEAIHNSGDYCMACWRLKDDFRLRAGYCNCRCRCEQVNDADDSSDEDDANNDLHFQGRREAISLFLAIGEVLSPHPPSHRVFLVGRGVNDEAEDDHVARPFRSGTQTPFDNTTNHLR